ncbi:MAG: tetratricopeptide repeat protein [Parvularculaceae bacterium]
MKILVAAALVSATAACSSPEERVEKFTESGEKFLEEGEFGKANVQFLNALKIDETHVPALEGLSKLAEKRQDYQMMFGVLQRIVRLDPENTEALVTLGNIYLAGSDETSALEYADQALALEPEYAAAMALKAVVHLQLEDYATAVEFARAALETEPANAEAVTVIAVERTRNKDYAGALKELDRALAFDDSAPVLHLMRIQTLSNLGRDDEVQGAYNRLIELFPESAAFRQIYASALIDRGELESASAQLEEGARLTPNEVEPVLDAARIGYRIGGIDRAKAVLEKFMDERPDDVELKFAYADFLRQQEEFAGAQSIYVAFAAENDRPALALRAKNELAALHILKEEFEKANALITEILSKDENNTEALVKRAGLKINEGEYDDAILDLRRALNNDPASTKAKLLMGIAFEQKGDIAFAESQMAQAVADSGHDTTTTNRFAKFLMRHGQFARAESALVESLSKHPANLDNLKLLAGARLNQQDWRGAEEAARLIEEIDARDPVVANILGAAYSGLEDFTSAIKALETQNARGPLEARPLATLVSAYLRSDRAEEAESILHRMIESDPDKYFARILLAQVYAAQQKTDDAEASLLGAIDRAPTQTQAYDILYRYYIREDRLDEAVALIENALTAYPDVHGFRIFKADILLGEERYEEAMAMYKELFERRPGDQLVANNYASLLSDLRDDEKSRTEALRVAKTLKTNDNPYLLDTLGWAYFRVGEVRQAISLLEQAIEGAPAMADLHYHLGAAYLAAEETDRGRDELEKALELGGDDFKYADEVNELLEGA